MQLTEEIERQRTKTVKLDGQVSEEKNKRLETQNEVKILQGELKKVQLYKNEHKHIYAYKC